MELLNMLIETIIPPPDADVRKQYIYRLRVTLVACTAFVGLFIFAALAFGVTPWFSGFVTKQEDHRFWSRQIDEDILVLREKQCSASNDEMRQLYWQKISEDIEEWQFLTGRPTYNLPNCRDL